jgi:DNA-binding SARP family transcriptional activator
MVHVCALGDLRVTRRDGTEVRAEEWRTGKTRDLLRLLALGAGRPLRVEYLTETLWPGVAHQQARNRLRTAASQIRLTLADHESVARHPDGYLLTDAVFDGHQFTDLAYRAASAAGRGEHAAVLVLARSAERLYRDDFHADEDDSAWATAERDRFRQVRQTLVCDAADAALAEQVHREALGYATLAVHLDPMSETAHRLLMRAHASMGEPAAALRAFETYRRRLADELGVDPSPQTRALHLELLRSGTSRRSTG